jgi:hypothetical protein
MQLKYLGSRVKNSTRNTATSEIKSLRVTRNGPELEGMDLVLTVLGGDQQEPPEAGHMMVAAGVDVGVETATSVV